MKYSEQSSPEQEVELDENIDIENRLIIHNDDHNTFDWVIEALMEVCHHTPHQAEQCAYIIHHRGKYAVKHGNFGMLKPMKDEIAERGINVTIE